MRPEEVLARVFGVPEATLSDSITPEELPAWDSLAHMMMVVELERTYSISIAPSDAIAARSVSAVKEMLTSYGVSW